MEILLIDACVRRKSRTRALAERLAERLGGRVSRVALADAGVAPLDGAALAARDEALAAGRTDAPLLRWARQFAAADLVVTAAPYWDLSFPALLKAYFEAVNAVGVTFAYGPDGRPFGLCRARTLVYVATAGGPILSDAFGYGYVRELCRTFYGIPDTRCVRAEGLDVAGADVPAILAAAEREIDALAAELSGRPGGPEFL